MFQTKISVYTLHNYRKNLVSQKLLPELNDVMFRAVMTLNYIRERVLHKRLFEEVCMSMAAQNRYRIFPAEVI